MTYTPFPVWPRPSDEGGGVTSHGALTGRNSANQHAISAITGLQDALDGAGGAAATEVVEVYSLATAAQFEAYFGATVTGTEITFPDLVSPGARVLVEVDPDGWLSYTTDGTAVAPVDTEQILAGGNANIIITRVDVYGTGSEAAPWSAYWYGDGALVPFAGIAARQNTVLRLDFLLTADAIASDGGTYTSTVSIELTDPFAGRLYVCNQSSIEVYEGVGTTTVPYVGRLGGSGMPDPDLILTASDATIEDSRETLWVRTNGSDYAPYEAFPHTVYSATKTDDYTVTGRDFGGVIEMDAATAKTITLPTGGEYGFPQLDLGVFVEFHNAGTGTLTIDHDANIVFTAGGTTVPTVTVLPGGSVKARCRVFDSTSEWAFTGDNEAWLWDGVTDYLPVYGAKRFVGPNDPAGEGFTLADGDKWEDTSA